MTSRIPRWSSKPQHYVCGHWAVEHKSDACECKKCDCRSFERDAVQHLPCEKPLSRAELNAKQKAEFEKFAAEVTPEKLEEIERIVDSLLSQLLG